MFKQSLRMLIRDWRAGELRLLLIAVAIAVTALSSVGFFADRLSQALNGQARQLLGADAVLSTDTPPPESMITAAQSAGITVARTVVFPSMLGATGEAAKNVAPQLSSIKAVSQGYPLRGALRIAGDIGLTRNC
jgi:putative ABC transport system permease protein